MNFDNSVWLIFILIGLMTTLPRASFIILGSRFFLPPAVQQGLRYAPAAALTAIVVPDMLIVAGEVQIFNPKLAAATTAAVTAVRFRKPWLPFLSGMAVLLVLRV